MAGLQNDGYPPLSDLVKALIPYFNHKDILVRISSRNAAQFLIPMLDESEKSSFVLSSSDVHDLLKALGRDLPTTSLFKLIIEFSRIPKNCDIFLKEGIFLYSIAVFYESGRPIEKNLAFSVMKVLVSHKLNEKNESHKQTSQRRPKFIDAETTNSSVKGLTESKLMVDSFGDLVINISSKLAEKISSFTSIPVTLETCNANNFRSIKCLLEELYKCCFQSNIEPNAISVYIEASSLMLKFILDLMKS